MKHKPEEPIPLEIYVAKQQTGCNTYQMMLLVTAGRNSLRASYKPGEVQCVESFYKECLDSPTSSPERFELHCRGKSRVFTLEERRDGYFGRQPIITTRDLFLRNLRASERKFLQGQFNILKNKYPLELTLID